MHSNPRYISANPARIFKLTTANYLDFASAFDLKNNNVLENALFALQKHRAEFVSVLFHFHIRIITFYWQKKQFW